MRVSKKTKNSGAHTGKINSFSHAVEAHARREHAKRDGNGQRAGTPTATACVGVPQRGAATTEARAAAGGWQSRRGASQRDRGGEGEGALAPPRHPADDTTADPRCTALLHGMHLSVKVAEYNPQTCHRHGGGGGHNQHDPLAHPHLGLDRVDEA